VQPLDFATAASDEELRLDPLFLSKPEKFFEDAPMLETEELRREINNLLCEAIPALSPAAGVSLVGPFAEIFNLETAPFKPADSDWPRGDGILWGYAPNPLDVFGKKWLHADFVDMAHVYTRGFWLNLVKEGGLDAKP